MSEEIKKEKIRKVFLDDLPHKEGVGNNRGKQVVNWLICHGCVVKFIYDNINGEIEIVDYNSKTSDLTVKYNDKIFTIKTGHFSNCKITKILGLRTIDFKNEIGTILKGTIRNIIIIDREYRIVDGSNGYTDKQKWYKYHCNKCNNEDWIIEGSLSKGRGCNTCCPTPRKLMVGTNTVWDTDSWILEYMVNPELAKTNGKNSKNKILVKCPICQRIKDNPVRIVDLIKSHSIGCPCGDGFSYPAKYVFSILEQCQLDFITEYSPCWCKFEFRDYIRQGIYDFVFKLKDKNYIVEADGDMGHGNSMSISDISADESIFIDKEKDRLANENGYEVIRINCRKSDSNFIKKNILNNYINTILDLSKIDWLECNKFAISSRTGKCYELWNGGVRDVVEIANIMKISISTIRTYLRYGAKNYLCDYKTVSKIREDKLIEACKYYNELNISVDGISKIMKLGRSCIRKYLRDGDKLGYCKYDDEKDKVDIRENQIKLMGKHIGIFKDGVLLGDFPSVSILEEQSEKLFGVKLLHSGIVQVANGKWEHYKKYTFKYITELQPA